MFGPTHVIGNDILDIGTSKYHNGRDQRAVGSGMMMPSRFDFGTPGHFDVPNVADVSICMVNIRLFATFNS